MSLGGDANTKEIWGEDTGNLYQGNPVADTIINGFFTVNRKWTVIYWNKAAEKILDVRAEDIIGKNLWERFAAIIPLSFYAIYHKAFIENIPVHFEEYWAERGEWFSVFCYAFKDRLSVSFKSSKYPVAQRQTISELKMFNELYRFVTEVTNDCLWEWNFDTGELFWIDGGHKRNFGYEIENTLIPQEFWESCLHPDDQLRVSAGLARILSRSYGTTWEEEYRFRKANGDYAFVHDRGHIIYDNNRASRMIGATQDISSRKLTEIKLLESERKLSLIARQTVNAVVITDADEHITWVNNAFTHITGYQPEEVMGRKPSDFLQGADTDPLTVQYLAQQIKYRKPFDCKIVNYSKSGQKHWMHIQGQALLDEQGNCKQFFAIQTDITEKVLLEAKLEEERRTKQNEITFAVLAAQENEREEIGKELHDNLNQILGAAKLYIEIAKTDKENQQVYLDKSSGYIVKVIEEIRRISQRLAVPGMQVIGLFESLRILFDDLMVAHPIKIEFRSEGVDEKELDKKMQLNIFRIVQEQLNNILKHANAAKAVIDFTKEGNEIILQISDDGNGCDLSKESSGVGIVNIKSRAALYSGKVAMTSALGKGFQLKVVLQLNDHLLH